MAGRKRRGLRRVGRARTRALAAVVGMTLMAALVTACGGGGSGGGAHGGHGGALTIGIEREFGALNPAIDSGLSGAGFALYLPYATLVTKSPKDGSLQPG